MKLTPKELEKYKHFIIGENKLVEEDTEFIVKLDEPRVIIKYKLEDSLFVDYDDFMNHIAEIQWIDGKTPDDEEKESILTDAWNFLCLDEQKLEEDSEDREYF